MGHCNGGEPIRPYEGYIFNDLGSPKGIPASMLSMRNSIHEGLRSCRYGALAPNLVQEGESVTST